VNTFRHSGKLGDIIYSLPAVRALGGGVFYVDHITGYMAKPPLGIETARMMVDLLETQKYIHRAALYRKESVTYDLDRFREKAVPVHFFNGMNAETDKLTELIWGGFARELRQRFVPKIEIDLLQFHWESVGLPGKPDPHVPWMTGIPKKPVSEIVICRTGRYSGAFDWSGVRRYAHRSVFLGHKEEWQAFRDAHFEIPFYKASSLLDFAQVVAGAKLYIGNQSFGLALADAMLVPRVVELCGPNPLPTSDINVHRNLEADLVEGYINS
jgi:hypothetical protein